MLIIGANQVQPVSEIEKPPFYTGLRTCANSSNLVIAFVTWDNNEHGMYCSQSGIYIDHYQVYSDLVLKGYNYTNKLQFIKWVR